VENPMEHFGACFGRCLPCFWGQRKPNMKHEHSMSPWVSLRAMFAMGLLNCDRRLNVGVVRGSNGSNCILDELLGAPDDTSSPIPSGTLWECLT
jgi:hypothetical protein